MFNIPLHSAIMMAVIIALLVIGSVVTQIKIQKHPEKNYLELRQRVSSWWWIIGIVFVCLALGFKATVIFFGMVSFLALKEFFSIVPLRQVDRRVIFWVYLAIPLQYYWTFIAWHTMFLIFIPVHLFLFIPLRMVLLGETQGFIRAAGVLHWGVMLTVFCISHLAALAALPVYNEQAGTMGLILFILFLTQFNDVMQYISGKQFGKHKIIPKVSPNKTWEGFIGGLICTALLATLLGQFLTPMSWQLSLLAGALISTMGFIGDVVISSVKRDLAIKDSGQLIPGHGGILDRIDSLTFTAPLFFHFYYYLMV